MQIWLVHEGHFAWSDVDTMPIYELRDIYNRLVKYMNDKAEAIEKARNKGR